jgi:uncharacterized lipoprotein YmbA
MTKLRPLMKNNAAKKAAMCFTMISLLFLVSSCSTSHKQTITYYQLEHSAVNYQQTSNAPSIIVTSIQIPSFYNGRGIVMQTSHYQRATSDWNLWADAPDNMFARHLTNQLRNTLPQYLVINTRESNNKPSRQNGRSISVSIQLNSLYGDTSGNAVLSGEIVIEDLISQRPVRFQHFNYTVELNESGYSGLVEAFERAWIKVGEQVKLLVIEQPE